MNITAEMNGMPGLVRLFRTRFNTGQILHAGIGGLGRYDTLIKSTLKDHNAQGPRRSIL